MNHLSGETLQLLIDGELDALAAAEAVRHLDGCPSCAAARARRETALAEFVAWRRTEKAAQPPRLALAGAALVFIAAAAAFYQTSPPSRSLAVYLPDARLTPGAARPISREQVCILPAIEDGRAVPVQLASQVFAGYGIRDPRPRAYEVDYLIAPALGGADDVRNMWPQPYDDGVWTARVKDALEDRLRSQVCAGRMELAAAQRDIASDWVAAYQKHFRTRRPLPEHSSFVKDRPWE